VSEVPPIGLPNILSQSDLIARTRGAQAGAEQALKDATAVELRRAAERRAEQVQSAARVEPAGRRRHEDEQRGSQEGHDRYDHAEEDPAEPDEGHHLDVSA
jgi:hypothetical protein